VRVLEHNAAAGELVSTPGVTLYQRRGGEALNCLHADDVPGGCGRGLDCSHCVIRNSVAEAFDGERVVRRRARLQLVRDGGTTDFYALISASPFRYQGKPLVLLVLEDISDIAELRRMIPICSYCRKIRDHNETWHRVEAYFKNNWDVDFSHGICPTCFKKQMGVVHNPLKSRKVTR
jgi:hypothetical protein